MTEVLGIVSVLLCAVIYIRCVRSLAGLPVLNGGLKNNVFQPPAPAVTDLSGLSVIVPAYNEERNIEACVRSILESSHAGFELIIVDDDSTDRTAELLLGIRDSRLRIVTGAERPAGWVGKQWPCHQGAAIARGRWLLFMDADVRIGHGVLEAVVRDADQSGAALYSVVPRLTFLCLAEHIVQPVIALLLAGRFNLSRANDPAASDAFACGPFLMFARDWYTHSGGHNALRKAHVEDVTFARMTKKAGRRLSLRTSPAVTLGMYRNSADLWEGWTKNFHFAVNESIINTIAVVVLVAFAFCAPPFIAVAGILSLRPVVVLCGVIAMALQVLMRVVLRKYAGLPFDGPWWMAIGGAWTAAIAVASAFKSRSGKNWTWRGRSISTGKSRD